MVAQERKEAQRSGVLVRPERVLYDPRGCSPEQRVWVRDVRDNGRCQWWDFKNGRFTQCEAKKPTRLEVHHVYPQGLQKLDPKPWGGETPYNLITLCEMHHDIQAPHMIGAKNSYKFDRDSYTRAILLAHQAVENGLQPYNLDWVGMLRAVARYRTDFVKAHFDEYFPYRAERRGRK